MNQRNSHSLILVTIGSLIWAAYSQVELYKITNPVAKFERWHSIFAKDALSIPAYQTVSNATDEQLWKLYDLSRQNKAFSDTMVEMTKLGDPRLVAKAYELVRSSGNKIANCVDSINAKANQPHQSDPAKTEAFRSTLPASPPSRSGTGQLTGDDHQASPPGFDAL